MKLDCVRIFVAYACFTLIGCSTPPTTETTFASFDTSSLNDAQAPDNIMLAVKPVCQYPELPTGCEITAVAMAIDYYVKAWESRGYQAVVIDCS